MAWTEVPPPPDDFSASALEFTGTTGRSARNNNPLNLEYRPGSYQDKYGAIMEPTGGGKDKKPRFAAFPDMMSGYLAGLEQIKLDQNRGMTLSQFVEKFAPRHENPTDQLISQYASAVGARRDTPLSQIPAEKLIVPMLRRESSTRITSREGEGILGTIGKYFGPASAEAAEVPPTGFKEIAPPPAGFREIAPPDSRSTGQRLAGVVADYLGLKLPVVGMTPAQIGALALGGTLGAAGGGPAGAVAGASLLYGGEEQAMKGLRQYAGTEPTQTLPESAIGAAKDVAIGATYEAAGQIGTVLTKPIMEKVGQFVTNRAKGLYERVLKVPPTVDPKVRDRAIQAAFEGDNAITKKGLEKLENDLNVYRDNVSKLVDEAADVGGVIDRNKADQGLARLKSWYSDSPFPDKFIKAIDQARGELRMRYPEKIPVDEAQRMKQRIYQIYEKAYKSREAVPSIDTDINQALAKEIMTELENNVPGVKQLNKEWSRKLDLLEYLARAVNRTRNYETVRLGDMVIATAGAAGERSIEGGFKAALINRVLNNPTFLSHLALRLGKSRPMTQALLNRTMAYGLTTQAREDIEAAQLPEKIEPESKRGFTILNQ